MMVSTLPKRKQQTSDTVPNHLQKRSKKSRKDKGTSEGRVPEQRKKGQNNENYNNINRGTEEISAEKVACEGLYSLGKVAEDCTNKANEITKKEVLKEYRKDQEGRNMIQSEENNIHVVKHWARTDLFRTAKFLSSTSLQSDGNIAKVAMKQIGLKKGQYNDLWCDQYRNILRKTVDQKRSNVDQEIRKSFESKYIHVFEKW